MGGHPSGNKTEKAGFGKRCVAWLLDYLLVVIVFAVVTFGLGTLIRVVAQSEVAALITFVQLIMGFVAIVVSILYHTVMEAVYGYTLGKRAMGIVVTTESGAPVSWTGSIVRNVIRFLGRFFFPISAILALLLASISAERQRLGDMIASTYVVKQ